MTLATRCGLAAEIFSENRFGGNWFTPAHWFNQPMQSGTFIPRNFSSTAVHATIVQDINTLVASGTASIGLATLNIGSGKTVTIEGSSVIQVFETFAGVSGGVVGNGGTIKLAADENRNGSARLSFSGLGTINGGVIEMGGLASPDGADNAIFSDNVLHLNTVTISGVGTIQSSFNNAGGVIQANRNERELALTGRGTAAVNTGMIQATSGGILSFFLITLNNESGAQKGTILASDSSRIVMNGSTRIIGGNITAPSGGTSPGADSPMILVDGPGVVWDGVTLTGGLVAVESFGLTLNNIITNNGLIDLTIFAANSPDIHVADPNTVFSGTGTIRLGDSLNTTISAVGQGTLLNDTGHTIAGEGRINFTAFDNLGIISADVQGGTIFVSPTGARVNGGTMQAINGGTLTLSSTRWNNASGKIIAGANSTVNLNGVTIVGGALDSGGTDLSDRGVFVALGSSGMLENVTLNGLLRIANGNQLTLKTALTNNGEVEVGDASVRGILAIDAAGVNLTGGGKILMTGRADNLIVQLSGATPAAFNNVNNLISGSGHIGNGSLIISNSGRILANGTNPLFVDPKSQLDLTAMFNDTGGSMKAAPNSHLRISLGSSTMENAALIEAESQGKVTITGRKVVNDGGTIKATGSQALLEITGVNVENLNGQIKAEASGAEVRLSSATISNGTLEAAAGSVIKNVSSATLIGGANAMKLTVKGLFEGIDASSTTLRGGEIEGFNATFLLNAAQNSTRIFVDGDLALDRAIISLRDSHPANPLQAIITGTAGSRLQLRTSDIEGTGLVGSDTLLFSTEGDASISAKIAGAQLIFDPADTAPMEHQATLEAIFGGILIIQDATITNSGSIRATTGSLTRINDSSILGGAGSAPIGRFKGIVSAQGGKVELSNALLRELRVSGGSIDGGTIENLTQATLDNVDIIGPFIGTDGSTTRLMREIRTIFGGSIAVNGLLGQTSLIIDGGDTAQRTAVLVKGDGRISLSDSPHNLVTGEEAGDTLINESITITGSGRLGNNALHIQNTGVIEAAGTSPLIVDVTGTTFTNDGILRVKPGATMTLADSNVITNSTTELPFTGTLNVPGRLTQTFATQAIIAGQLNAGSVVMEDAVDFTIASGGSAQVTGEFRQDGGFLLINGQLTAGNYRFLGGVRRGSGTLNGDVVTTAGLTAPGQSPGILNISGTYAQAAPAALEIEIAGATPGTQHDRLAVTGQAALAGNLDLVRVDPFTATAGQTFDIVTFAASTGRFDRVTGMEAGNGLLFAPVYLADRLRLIATYPGDANLDLAVTDADFNILYANFGDTAADWIDGDFNGDRIVNFSDFQLLEVNFGNAAAMPAAVPEPAGALALLAFTVVIIRTSRARFS